MSFCNIQFRRKSDGTIEVKNKRGEISPLYSKLVEYTNQNDVYQGREWFFDKLVEQGKLKSTDNKELSLGLYSIAYHSDKSEGYWINKIDQLLPEPFYPQEGINSSFIKPDQSINYKLKIINALDKTNRNIFEQSKLQGWVNDLSRFGTPKEQIELFKEIVKDGMSKNEIISSLLATYDFDVQVNTALSGVDIETGLPTKNSDYYSNLTVPGGTNGSYIEANIETPMIVPSIQSHAQFKTENTIGWMRADEKQNYQEKDIDNLIEIMKKSGILEVNCR